VLNIDEEEADVCSWCIVIIPRWPNILKF